MATNKYPFYKEIRNQLDSYLKNELGINQEKRWTQGHTILDDGKTTAFVWLLQIMVNPQTSLAGKIKDEIKKSKLYGPDYLRVYVNPNIKDRLMFEVRDRIKFIQYLEQEGIYIKEKESE